MGNFGPESGASHEDLVTEQSIRSRITDPRFFDGVRRPAHLNHIEQLKLAADEIDADGPEKGSAVAFLQLSGFVGVHAAAEARASVEARDRQV